MRGSAHRLQEGRGPSPTVYCVLHSSGDIRHTGHHEGVSKLRQSRRNLGVKGNYRLSHQHVVEGVERKKRWKGKNQPGFYKYKVFISVEMSVSNNSISEDLHYKHSAVIYISSILFNL